MPFSGATAKVQAMRLLIVEDEVKMAALLRRGLIEDGHLVEIAGDGETAVAMARASEYDAIVLDVALPRLDGFSACRRIREAGVWTGVLMLTARDSVLDRVSGLDCGADDYLVKPFSFSELLARLRALTRRGGQPRPTQLVVDDLVLDRSQLLEYAWDYGYENRSNVVDVYIRYLRKKIDLPFQRSSIETVRGAGYRLRSDAR